MATKSISKAQFIENVRRFTGLNSNAAADLMAEKVIEAIVFSAGQGRLTIREFGTFETVVTPARPGRNPSTGETIHIPAREKLKFKASPLLRKD